MAAGKFASQRRRLGVKRVSSFALSAFLVSAASTLFLQGDILTGCTCSDYTLTMVHYSPIFPTGHQLLVMSLTFYGQSNLSGTVPAFQQT